MGQLATDHMADKAKPKRDDKAAKIARDLVRKAKFIADTKGISIAEYLSDKLRPIIERDWLVALKQTDQHPDD